jgi:hypothetical protein
MPVWRESFDNEEALGQNKTVMTTLAEIESAAAALSQKEKQELLLFLAARLQAQGQRLPAPRQFTLEQLQGWIAEDEAGWKNFQAGQ